MKTQEMFAGFSVGAGKDRFDERVKLGGEANDCKVSAKDTHGAVCVLNLLVEVVGRFARPPSAEIRRHGSLPLPKLRGKSARPVGMIAYGI